MLVDYLVIEHLGRTDAVHSIDKSADALGGFVLHLLQRTSNARFHRRHALVHVGWHPGPFKVVSALPASYRVPVAHPQQVLERQKFPRRNPALP